MVSPDIFYVEDDQDFAFILEHAVKEVRDDLTLSVVEDGRDAIQALERFAEDKLRPKIILLDLNLPGLSGLDVLKRIKEIPYLRHTPVILFSTSDDPMDVKASYEFGANAYITKPSGYNNLITCIRSLHEFWFNQNKTIN
ncbi:response regulator [Pedobacter metabolipauper]|uniref:Response regulator receiver domain-containing protein n=1 Tax=Pedobacter metabolipauper TaxID=425513 RepID=A0A4R6T160_9SPHI|nr:response regulator [Pedobacter metabolipauper]TDQ11081.1 response regulator receiver domain-containing protein [Pedobacter metabolipauper]